MPSETKPTTIRWNSSDLEHIEKLRELYGVTSDAEIVRMGLRAALREAEAIPAALELIEKKGKRPKASR